LTGSALSLGCISRLIGEHSAYLIPHSRISGSRQSRGGFMPITGAPAKRCASVARYASRCCRAMTASSTRIRQSTARSWHQRRWHRSRVSPRHRSIVCRPPSQRTARTIVGANCRPCRSGTTYAGSRCWKPRWAPSKWRPLTACWRLQGWPPGGHQAGSPPFICRDQKAQPTRPTADHPAPPCDGNRLRLVDKAFTSVIMTPRAEL